MKAFFRLLGDVTALVSSFPGVLILCFFLVPRDLQWWQIGLVGLAWYWGGFFLAAVFYGLGASTARPTKPRGWGKLKWTRILASKLTAADIYFPCPACKGHLVVERRGRGRTVSCPHCNAEIGIPDISRMAQTIRFLNRKAVHKFTLWTLGATVAAALPIGTVLYRNHTQRYLRAAEVQLDLGTKDRAVPLLEKHIHVNPTDYSSRLWLGELLADQDQHQRAFHVYLQVLTDLEDKRSVEEELSSAFQGVLHAMLVLSSDVSARADEARENGDYSEALDLYMQELEVLSQWNPLSWYDIHESELSKWDQGSAQRFFCRRIETGVRVLYVVGCLLLPEYTDRLDSGMVRLRTYVAEVTSTKLGQEDPLCPGLITTLLNDVERIISQDGISKGLAALLLIEEMAASLGLDRLCGDQSELKVTKALLLAGCNRFQEAKELLAAVAASRASRHRSLEYEYTYIQLLDLQKQAREAFEGSSFNAAAYLFQKAAESAKWIEEFFEHSVEDDAATKLWFPDLSGIVKVPSKMRADLLANAADSLVEAATAAAEDKRYLDALGVLETLRAEFSDYQPDEIEELQTDYELLAWLHKKPVQAWLKYMEKADEACDASDWSAAAQLFVHAAANHPPCVGEPRHICERINADVARCKYNAAAALVNEWAFDDAEAVLRDLRSTHPGYQVRDVEELVDKAQRQRIASLRLRADEYFDERKWSLTIKAYSRLGKYLQSLDSPEEWDDYIAECRYNIAVALINDFRVGDAYRVLKQIRREHPNYLPLKVEDSIKEMSKYPILLGY